MTVRRLVCPLGNVANILRLCESASPPCCLKEIPFRVAKKLMGLMDGGATVQDSPRRRSSAGKVAVASTYLLVAGLGFPANVLRPARLSSPSFSC